MAAGYDIGLSGSSSNSIAPNLNSAMSLTGGGGSGGSGPSFASAVNNKNIWPWIVMAGAVLVLALMLMRRKK